MTSKQLRQKYLDFFKSRGHAIIPSASLLPENDSTLLFTNSGMSPLVPYLLGEKHPAGVRLANSQKSFRTEDIEEVGDNRHNTFFEMLGNWSLGDYFKQEQLNWWFEFLFEELKLDPKKIYQTVYAGDDLVPKDIDSVQILQAIFKKYGIDAKEGITTTTKGALGSGVELVFENKADEERIFAYRDKNWWKRGDSVGELGGPDSETFYDTGKKHDAKFGEHCHLNCDCGRFLEIGNSVFMQYQKTADGWQELENKNVDFGGGFERLAMVTQKKDNIFSTDLFINVIKKIEELSGKKYQDNVQAFEIVADHIKSATFIMGDEKGVGPSNTDQGYIVRRLIRRAINYGRKLGIAQDFWIRSVAEIIIADYKDIYDELDKNQGFVISNFIEEESKFSTTLEKGLKEFNKIVEELKIKKLELKIDSVKAFDLYQTYGFPVEMTIEIAKENGIEVDESGFAEELKKHQESSRSASAGKFKGGLADSSEATKKLHTATHLLHAALRTVLGTHVEQKGSNITAERLRFDFTHTEKMTPEQIQQTENLVNDVIQKKIPVVCYNELAVDEAKAKGAIGLFGSKYGDKVKMYEIGEFSKEICGGPHVENLSELGVFKILKEESSSSGVRRIKGVLV
jgi:alanyl-tRNA synthetase